MKKESNYSTDTGKAQKTTDKSEQLENEKNEEISKIRYNKLL